MLKTVALTRSFVALAVGLAATFSGASAEMYKDIGPLDSLGDVKAKFPGASFVRQRPAWAQESDALYKMTGSGLSGTTVVKFYDVRPRYREQANQEADEEKKQNLLKFAAQTDEEALIVEWVRWIPVTPIPLVRFVSKYGPFEKSGFGSEDLQPFREWTSKGLSAFLADDEKNVVHVEFTFTRADERAAWQRRYGIIPKWLQDEAPKQPAKAPTSSPPSPTSPRRTAK